MNNFEYKEDNYMNNIFFSLILVIFFICFSSMLFIKIIMKPDDLDFIIKYVFFNGLADYWGKDFLNFMMFNPSFYLSICWSNFIFLQNVCYLSFLVYYMKFMLCWIYTLFVIMFCFLMFYKTDDMQKQKQYSLIASWLLLILSLILGLLYFNLDTMGMSNEMFMFMKEMEWVSFFNMKYTMGMDSISLLFMWLIFLLMPMCMLITYTSITYSYKELLMLLFLIEFLLFNVFMTMDLFFFFIFFESMLMPMFLMMGIWGSSQSKMHASYQFFFYTMMGSIFMLFAMLLIYNTMQTTDVSMLYLTNFSFERQMILWICFFIAFSMKVPLFPFHIWLPEAHVEAPTVGSVLLAGILLKLGTYGMLRYLIFCFHEANMYFMPLVYTLSILGMIYTSFTTMRQIDLKKCIAYSSVGHMSYVMLGLFSNTMYGMMGSIMLMMGHGLISSGLFFLMGMLYDSYKTSLLRYYSGLAQTMPLYSFFFFFLMFSNLSFPGTMNFMAEFLILLGVANTNMYIAMFSILAMMLSAVYSMWLLNRLIFGSMDIKYFHKYSDLSKKEFFVCFILCLLILMFGLFPNMMICLIEYDIMKYMGYK